MSQATVSIGRVRIDAGRAARSLAVSAKQLFNRNDELDVRHIFSFLDSFDVQNDRGFERLKRDPQIAQLLKERPQLDEVLQPLEKFLDYPEDSLGYAYGRYMLSERLDAEVLVQASEAFDRKRFTDPEAVYLFERLRTLHDVWHALAGYGADLGGEIGILTFTLGHVPAPGLAFLMGSVFVGAPLLLPEKRLGMSAYMIQAFRRGRRARGLVGAPWEKLLERPLAEVQRELRVLPSNVAHPNGIYHWDPKKQRVRRPPGTDLQYLSGRLH